MKSNGKREPNQSNMLRVDLEASPTKDTFIPPSIVVSNLNL
jgi:hypothetical protein